MATESGAGEGQALADRLLEALDAGRPPDWDAFLSAYRFWLTHVAAGCLTRNSKFGSEFESPEELVNAFLAEKVFPPRQARLMLGAPARGECPLRPRLATSLRNFCIDVLRSRPPVGVWETADALDIAEARNEMPLPDYEDVASAIVRQLGAIRACLPVQQGAPYRPALLLRHRLDWAGVFDGVRLHQTSGGDSVELTLAVLEELTAWENDELQTRLGESLVTLGKTWELIRPRLLAAADRRLSSDDAAGTLRVPRDLWDQWISRGRRRLRQHLGTEYAEVFALWA
jgi:hypothetical protein